MRNKCISIIGMLVLLVTLGGCGTGDVVDQIANVAQQGDENVIAVREGSPYSYPDKKFGDAFDAFFESPTWKYFVGTKEGPDEDGDGEADYTEKDVDIVEFTGYCMYQDVKVKALIQFTLNKSDDTFEATYLSFNDVPQSNLMLLALLDTAFAEEGDDETAEGETERGAQGTGSESPYPEGMDYSPYDVDPLEIAGYYTGTYGQSTADISIYTSPEDDEVGNIKLYLDSEVPEYGGLSIEGRLIKLDANLYYVTDSEYYILLGIGNEDGITMELYINNEYVEFYMMIDHYMS